MKNHKKIQILSSEEMRKEVAGKPGEAPKMSNCAISHECENGRQLGCSGAQCVELYDTNFDRDFIGLQCYDEAGNLTYDERCRSTDSGSGSGGGGTVDIESPENLEKRYAACSGLTFGSGCEWRDDTAMMHFGTCEWSTKPPFTKLICKTRN